MSYIKIVRVSVETVRLAKTITQLLILGAWLIVMLGAVLTSGVSLRQGSGPVPVPMLNGVGSLPMFVMAGASLIVVVALIATDRAFR